MLASAREALHAEWTKLRTVPSTAWLLLAAVALTVGASALTAAIVKCPASCGADTTKISLTGVELGQAVVAVLAVLVITSEYSTSMIRVTLAAIPHRSAMLAAKAAIITGVVLTAGVMGVLGSLLAGRMLLPDNGFTGIHGVASLFYAPTQRAAIGSVLYLVLIALFSLGIATAVRDSGAAIAVVLGVLYVIPVIGHLILNAHWERRFQRYTPMDAGLAVQATKNLAKLPIGPWVGLGVLGAYALVALVAGGLLLRLRDA